MHSQKLSDKDRSLKLQNESEADQERGLRGSRAKGKKLEEKE